MQANADTTPPSAVALPHQFVRLAQAVAGAAVIIACLEAGIFIQRDLGVPVPGNVIGMILLLFLLQTKVVADAWVSGPCTVLLLLLPAMFVPIYVVPLSDPAFWSRHGTTLLPAAVIGVAITLAVTAWLANWMLRQ